MDCLLLLVFRMFPEVAGCGKTDNFSGGNGLHFPAVSEIMGCIIQYINTTARRPPRTRAMVGLFVLRGKMNRNQETSTFIFVSLCKIITFYLYLSYHRSHFTPNICYCLHNLTCKVCVRLPHVQCVLCAAINTALQHRADTV